MQSEEEKTLLELATSSHGNNRQPRRPSSSWSSSAHPFQQDRSKPVNQIEVGSKECQTWAPLNGSLVCLLAGWLIRLFVCLLLDCVIFIIATKTHFIEPVIIIATEHYHHSFVHSFSIRLDSSFPVVSLLFSCFLWFIFCSPFRPIHSSTS